mmetsp:Transcript_39212/g.92239  ORF Transcript_39212/g.92239 Transcript_39212/m.92239 type:complete len:137 (+) Transcript_39212:696-1106(+)
MVERLVWHELAECEGGRIIVCRLGPAPPLSTAGATAASIRCRHASPAPEEPAMPIPPAPALTHLLLQRGQASRLPLAGARQLRSVAGTLWITVDHDRRDIVLEPGQSVHLQGGEGVTVSALQGPAVLDLHPAASGT